MKQIGGTGIIGQDMVCGFRKKTIIFDKWEDGDWKSEDGLPKGNSTRIRTPWNCKKKIKPNANYEVDPCGITIGTRIYKKDGTYIGNNSFGSKKFKFITTSDSYYLLFVAVTNNKSFKLVVKEVS